MLQPRWHAPLHTTKLCKHEFVEKKPCCKDSEHMHFRFDSLRQITCTVGGQFIHSDTRLFSSPCTHGGYGWLLDFCRMCSRVCIFCDFPQSTWSTNYQSAQTCTYLNILKVNNKSVESNGDLFFYFKRGHIKKPCKESLGQNDMNFHGRLLLFMFFFALFVWHWSHWSEEDLLYRRQPEDALQAMCPALVVTLRFGWTQSIIR